MILWASRRLAFGGGQRQKLKLRRLRGGIIGLALSLVPLTIVLHVAEGMIQGITARYLETGTGHLRIEARLNMDASRMDQMAEDLLQLDQVTAAVPERQGLGLVRTDQGSSGVQIRALPSDAFERDKGLSIYLEVEEGEFRLTEEQDLVIGLGLAQELGVKVGDEVRLMTVRRSSNGGLLPRISRFELKGIVSSGYRELDKLWVFIPLERGRSILPQDQSVDFISLKLEDPFILSNPLIQRDPERGIEFLRTVQNHLGFDWRVLTWFELERSQYMSFLGTKNMLVFIMIIILLVAAVNIATTMINLVAERQQEFAVLKALGANPWTVAGIVVTIGSLSGLIGIVLGLGLGSLCVVFINEIIAGIEAVLNLFASSGSEIQIINPEFYLERIPVLLLPEYLLMQGGLALLLSLLASLIPAIRATHMHPMILFRRD